jgi:phosphatidylinositol glycan class B
MTEIIADVSGVSRLTISALRFHPLAMVLVLATALRLPLAFWPNVMHADELFQYLDPAWRVLGHDGIISWEWRSGIRSWFLPSVMAGPVSLGDWIAPGGTGGLVAARLAAALASLSIVASAWFFGARISQTHAIVAAFVAAIWFEFVAFAPHTLSEPFATAVILPAAVLLTRTSLSPKHLAVGGALLALAFALRFQYAPATAVLALGACWGRWRNVAPLTAGGVITLAFTGVADAAQGAVPFTWLIANVQQNLLYDRAAEYGVAPATAYLASFWTMWSVALVPIVLAIRQGWRRAPLLLAMAVTDIAFHSLIGHKEYRFIFLSVAILIIIAALGSADWIVMWARARRTQPSRMLLAVASGWALISAALAATGTMPDIWMNGINEAQLAARLRGDPALCGLALYDMPYLLLPERERLVGGSGLYAFHPADPFATPDLAATVRKAAPAFNRILALREATSDLPASFALRNCTGMNGIDVCIFGRPGSCDATAARPLEFNDVLVRVTSECSRVAQSPAVDRRTH